jgi:hypothetical protein
MVALAEVGAAAQGNVYPVALLEGRKTALVLFAAGFYGAQDGYWIHQAGLRATCVDIQAGRLGEMARMYPEDWEFAVEEAFDFAERAQIEGRRWDVVSVDCPSGMFDECAEHAGLWCDLARHAVILGTGRHDAVRVPVGWRATDTIRRSHVAYWTVLEPL